LAFFDLVGAAERLRRARRRLPPQERAKCERRKEKERTFLPFGSLFYAQVLPVFRCGRRRKKENERRKLKQRTEGKKKAKEEGKSKGKRKVN
jgi:hypothetical protein